MPRTPKATTEDTTVQHNTQLQAQDAQAVQILQATAAQFSDAERETTFLIGQRIGRKQVNESLQKLLTVTDLMDLKTIKESKQFKDLRFFSGWKTRNHYDF